MMFERADPRLRCECKGPEPLLGFEVLLRGQSRYFLLQQLLNDSVWPHNDHIMTPNDHLMTGLYFEPTASLTFGAVLPLTSLVLLMMTVLGLLQIGSLLVRPESRARLELGPQYMHAEVTI